MEVRIRVQPTGLLNGKPWPEAGDVIDVPDVVAVDLLNAQAAEAVVSRPVPEKAVAKKQPETRKGLTAKDV